MAGTVTLTGTLQNILGTADAGGSVSIALQNYGSNVPRIAGAGVLVITTFKVTAAAGTFSISGLYRNDLIQPANTFYEITFVSDTGVSAVQAYQFTADGTFDLSSVTPLNTTIQPIVGLGVFTATTPGLVPASSGGTTNFLRADGVFALPTAGGGFTPFTPVSHQFLTGVNAGGVFSSAQPAAADLSDGTTGTGSVVLSASPTLTGTLTTATITATGTINALTLQQRTATGAFAIMDNLGVSHFFISGTSPYTNTFLQGNGAGVVFLGSAAKASVADTTGNIVTAGSITLQNTSQLLPATVANDTAGGILFTNNAGNTIQFGNGGTLFLGSTGHRGQNIGFFGGTSGDMSLAPPAAAGSSPVLSLPSLTGNDTLVAKATTDTLTNKTFETTSNTFSINGTAVSTGVPRTALDSTGKGWQFLGTATGSGVTVGPVTTTGTFQQYMIRYQIKGYSGGTPVGRFLCGNTTPSTTALTNSFKVSEDLTAASSGAGATAIPGLPLAQTLSNTQRSGTIFIDGASGAVKVLDVFGNEQTPSVSSTPTLFRGASFFSDLGTNLPLKQFQLTVYDTLTAVAASSNTFVTGTYLTVWGRNND